MKFKEGSRVEALRRRKDPYGSWFPAKILSMNGCEFTVRYARLLTTKGELVIDKIHEDDIRPCPPSVHGGESWVVDDITEVFDLRSWRAGKVAKVLNNNYFVVELFGSMKLKKFHISDMRVRQAWHNNQWIMLGKVSQKKHFDNDFNHTTYLSSGADGMKFEDERTRKRYKKNYSGTISPKRSANKNISFHENIFPDNAAVRGTNKRRILTSKLDEHRQLTRKASRKVDVDPFPNVLVGEDCMRSSNPPLQYIEENIECSVASCSGNIPENTIQNTRKHSRENASNYFDDAISPNQSKSKKLIASEDDFAADIHELELHAYQSTVKALYASGPLSWEQESVLTNLRLSLNISNEEHLLQLRHLLSA